MKTNTLVNALALIVFVAASSQAQATGFIKFDGVEGESKATAEERQPRPVETTKHLDKASPKLAESIGTDKAKDKPSKSQKSEGRVRVFDGAH